VKGCTPIPGGFVCSRGGRAAKAKPCVTCGAPSAFLCDGPKPAKSRKRSPTCDAPICADHATEIGPDAHHCPTCAEAAPTPRAAEAPAEAPPQRPPPAPPPELAAAPTAPPPEAARDELDERDLEPTGPPPPRPPGSPWTTPAVIRPKEADPWIALLAECPARRGRDEHAGRMHVYGSREVDTGGHWPGLPRCVLDGVCCVAHRTLEPAERTTTAFEQLVRVQEREASRARLREASIRAAAHLTDPERRKAFVDEYAPIAWEPGPELHLPARPPPLLLHQMQNDIGRELDKLAEKNAARWREDTRARHATATPHPEERKCPASTPISSSTPKPRAAAA